jgi:pimeloyl-ACP methyl ester carboxylesterase
LAKAEGGSHATELRVAAAGFSRKIKAPFEGLLNRFRHYQRNTVFEESGMERLKTPTGVTVSYDKSGSGPPLVLAHGAFSDHHTNWEFVKPSFRKEFTVYAIARRGRGGTDTTEGHRVEDEVGDLVAVIEAAGEPVFLLGHSYGAHCALGAAHRVPNRVRKVVLYEPGRPDLFPDDVLARLEALAARGSWDSFAMTFFRDALLVPIRDLEELRQSDLWPPIVADAPASLGDIRALTRHASDAARYRTLNIPVLLQIGSESPRDLYVTDALAAVLPDARIEALPGQAHEGMTTAPEMYVEAVRRFLLGSAEGADLRELLGVPGRV